ncbi:MAG: hypothetical protein IPN36_08425 [Bacteroidetes bacterium]|nr:hypothetical protein [Bacteroidota bacterium]
MLGSGDGTITYFWESSTTSASAGFSTIPGETGDSYDPSGISVNTWFRRVTVSTIGLSSCQSPSNAVLVSVLTIGPPSVTAGVSTTSACVGSLINLTATSNNLFQLLQIQIRQSLTTTQPE